MNSNELYHYGVLGMKWGVRRYQNKDGSLTPEGAKRYDRDVKENLSRKKDRRIDTSKPDPKRWVKEDLKRTKDVVDSSSSLVNKLDRLNDELASKKSSKSKKNYDLSSMTDQEIRQKINRALLEKQYNELLNSNQQHISKGREYVSSILKGSSQALALGGSALSIALAIKELTG